MREINKERQEAEAAWERLQSPEMKQSLLKMLMLQRRAGWTHRHMITAMEAIDGAARCTPDILRAVARLPGDRLDPGEPARGQDRMQAFREALETFPDDAWRAAADAVRRDDMTLIPYLSPWYPPLLAHFPLSPPSVLFVRGEGYRRAVRQPYQLTVVGSRKMTGYGQRFLELHLPPVVERPTTVISGLAYGVDACAHRTAVRTGGLTLAVLPCGLDRCYPSDHRELAREIMASGALISEYLPGTPVRRSHFAARNRLLAGLGQNTLVVEADYRSGALITANQAQDGGRDTLALPGSVFAPMSRGTLNLIYEGATPLRHGGDIITAMGQPAPRPFPRAGTDLPVGRDRETARDAADIPVDEVPDMPPLERKILELLRQETLSSDRVARRLDHALIPVLLALSRLELKGLVDQEQGLYALTSLGHSSI